MFNNGAQDEVTVGVFEMPAAVHTTFSSTQPKSGILKVFRHNCLPVHCLY